MRSFASCWELASPSFVKNSLVPDLAIVPRCLTRSSFVMPMPVSVTCRTWLSLSACITHIIGIIKANNKHDTEVITFCVICNYLSRPHLNQIQCVHLASNLLHVWPFIAKNLFLSLKKIKISMPILQKIWTTNAAVLALNVLHVSMVEISTNSQ